MQMTLEEAIGYVASDELIEVSSNYAHCYHEISFKHVFYKFLNFK